MANYQSLFRVFFSTTPIVNSTQMYPRLMEHTLSDSADGESLVLKKEIITFKSPIIGGF